jgi:hypothetical protein
MTLDPWWTRDHGAARLLRGLGGHYDNSEREGEKVSVFSPMTSLGGGATKMATRWHSTEAVGGTPMRRWFWA